MAEALGGQLGRLARGLQGDARGTVPLREARLAFTVAADTPTPVLPGAVEVTVTVTALWELQPDDLG